jgi:inositol oxygenase
MESPPLKRARRQDYGAVAVLTLADLCDFTFQMEHRAPSSSSPSSSSSRIEGEERLLIFRNDRPGAIAKIILCVTTSSSSSSCNRHSPSFPSVVISASNSAIPTTFTAKVQVLECKAAYRGCDLGGLLFTEAVQRLMVLLLNESGSALLLELDAEEDETRHNKLIHFYERLGFRVKSNAKIQYLSHYGETFRKVPMSMYITERPQDDRIEALNSSQISSCSYFSSDSRFIPVHLIDRSNRNCAVTGSGTCENSARNTPPQHWIIFQADAASTVMELRTTTGGCLCVDPKGNCSLVQRQEAYPTTNPSSCNFQFLLPIEERSSCSRGHHPSVCLIQSLAFGTYLSLENATLECFASPVFWQFVNTNGQQYDLQCTMDTPAIRNHYRRSWIVQTLDFVCSERKKMEQDSQERTRRTLKEALDAVRCVSADPFAPKTDKGYNLCSMGFRAAETFRLAGHPDWIQLVALLYNLGRVHGVSIDTNGEKEEDEVGMYDWTIAERSRVLGYTEKNGKTVFDEFCVARDGSDEAFYPHGCGLMHVTHTWTGPEYMYNVLRLNASELPTEAALVLRLAALGDWHSGTCYRELESDDDRDVKDLVAEFDAVYNASFLSQGGRSLSDEECDELWHTYYAPIASKYNLDGQLTW